MNPKFLWILTLAAIACPLIANAEDQRDDHNQSIRGHMSEIKKSSDFREKIDEV